MTSRYQNCNILASYFGFIQIHCRFYYHISLSYFNYHCWCVDVNLNWRNIFTQILSETEIGNGYHQWFWRLRQFLVTMISPSSGNICRVTLWKEFTSHRWIPFKRPVTRSFDVFFDVRLNKRLSKQSRCCWFETPSSSSWRHCNAPK